MKTTRVRSWLMAGLLVGFSAHGQTNSWVSSVDNFWDVPFAWSLGGPPALTQAATLITNTGTKVIRIDQCTMEFAPGSTTISNLNLTAPVGSLSTLILSNSPDISCTPSPQLTVVNDFTIGAHSVLSVNTDSTVRVQGVSGGAFNIDGEVRLGKDGTLIATNVTTWLGRSATGSLNMSGGTMLTRDLVVATNASTIGTLTVGGGTLTASNLLVAASAGATGAVWVTGSGQLIVTNSNGFLSVGSSGIGQMLISNGTVTLRAMQVGRNAGSQGTLTMAGGTLSLSFPLVVGSSTNSMGTVWMTGGQLMMSNSILLGVSGIGQMTMSNGTATAAGMTLGLSGSARPQGFFTMTGGTLTLTDLLVAGSGDGATGTVVIAGGQLFATNSSIFVGSFGLGQMTVSNAPVRCRELYVAAVSSPGTFNLAGTAMVALSSNLFVGLPSGSTGTVWISGGTLSVTEADAFIGYAGVGQLTVSNGTMLASNLTVGVAAGARGTVLLPGGAMSVSMSLLIGDCSSNAVGVVTVDGGALTVTNAAGSAALDVRDGTLTLSSGTLVVDKFVMTNSCATFLQTGGNLVYSSAVLSGNRDDDGDGISNGYEQDHALDPLNPNDANLDSDGDGQSNLQEFLAGTDATNSASFFGITGIADESNDVRVTWMTGPGKTNTLERTVGADGSFSNNFAAIFTVTNTVGTSTNYLDAGAATNFPASYYRVRLVP